jgi:hypothetical protein
MTIELTPEEAGLAQRALEELASRAAGERLPTLRERAGALAVKFRALARPKRPRAASPSPQNGRRLAQMAHQGGSGPGPGAFVSFSPPLTPP